MRVRLLCLAGALWASPGLATLDETPDAGYHGECQMTETCRADDTCGTTPALGELLLVIDGAVTWMGRDEANLSPIDHYPSLDAALPLPRLDTRRRSFLTDLPPDGTARRFALRVQTLRPETGDPILREQYFVLRCHGF